MIIHPIANHSTLPDMPSGTVSGHDERYYTKDEVNDIVEGNTFDFFLNNTNSDISSPTQYFVMDPTVTGEGESTFSDTITNDAFLIDTWATSTSEPTFSALVKGIYAFHIHAETTTGANVGSVRLYWELYRRLADSPFTETLLITSEESDILVGAETEYDIHGTLATDVMLDATDRLVLKVYANIEVSRPTDPLVTLTAEGTTAAHFEVVTTITAFDDRYVQVNGDTMTGPLNMGTNDITNVGTIVSGNITILDVTPVLVFKDSNNTGAASIGFIEWRDSANTRLGFLGNSTNQNDDLLWKNEFSGGHIKIETTGAGEFQIFANTVFGGTIASGAITSQGNMIIDVDDAEALLVRKDGDGGDVFIVDTVNGGVDITGGLDVTGFATSTNSVSVAMLDFTTAETQVIFNANAPYALEIIDSWAINRGTSQMTFVVSDGSDTICGAILAAASQGDIMRVPKIFTTFSQIAANGTLDVTTTTKDTVNALIFVMYRKAL